MNPSLTVAGEILSFARQSGLLYLPVPAADWQFAVYRALPNKTIFISEKINTENSK